jgi:heat shock protein HtpX
MTADHSKQANLWVIEEQKTAKIFLVLGFVALIHFIGIYCAWIIIKIIFWTRWALYHPEQEFNWFGWDTVGVLAIALLVTALHWYLTSQNAVRRILALLRARAPDPRDKYHHVFENIVGEIESAAGGVRVERYVLPTGAMNAFALADPQGRKVIGVTEGLISRLDRAETQSVVAHEMAHIISGDCLFITLTTALFGIYGEALNQVTKINRGTVEVDGRQKNPATFFLFSIPILLILYVVENLGQLLNLFISREREYRADAAAVKYTREPLSLARALFKIGGHWRGAGLEGENLANIFILSPELKPMEERDGFIANLFSTHPPLSRRLEVILNMAHADMAIISGSLKETSAIVPDPGGVAAEPRFFVEQASGWTGPFTILQLQTVDGINPETKLRTANTDTYLTAAELPGLDYFFKVRTEPVWKIRRLCPVCRQWLVVEEYEGLVILRCAFCGGVLIENEKLPRIFTRREKSFTESIRRTAELLRQDLIRRRKGFKILISTLHPFPCPRCGKTMARKFFSYAYHVEVDECWNCGVTWFDQDELEILQYLIENDKDKDIR